MRDEHEAADASAKTIVEVGAGALRRIGVLEQELAAAIRQLGAARRALERISTYETDWTVGPAANVNALQMLAERGLEASVAAKLPNTVTTTDETKPGRTQRET